LPGKVTELLASELDERMVVGRFVRRRAVSNAIRKSRIESSLEKSQCQALFAPLTSA
jgi:hypothetical protein